jgi:hypothetical protein
MTVLRTAVLSRFTTSTNWCAPSDSNRALPDEESGAIPRLLDAHVLNIVPAAGLEPAQLKGLLLCRSSSAGILGIVESNHVIAGAKTRRRPGWLIPTMVSPARFKRATSAFGGRRSIRLSYGESSYGCTARAESNRYRHDTGVLLLR